MIYTSLTLPSFLKHYGIYGKSEKLFLSNFPDSPQAEILKILFQKSN